MARIPESEIERLKTEISLQRLVEDSGIELKKSGADLLGLRPFHDDREPSLVISPAKNLWHCLGACRMGGGVIDWVIKARGVSFRHAVELLREGLPSLAAHPVAGAAEPVSAAARVPWPPRWPAPPKRCARSLSDLKGIGCNFGWPVHISPLFWAIE